MANESILVVDDNPTNLKLVAFLLTTNGFSVRLAANADEALAAVTQQVPRLILMDLQLPGMDGLTLTAKLKADPATSEIMIVALTAYAMKGDEERALAAGCAGYLTKPIDTRSLPARLRKYLHDDGQPRPEEPRP
jgi:CheY-like chemotaxis protein